VLLNDRDFAAQALVFSQRGGGKICSP